MRLIKILLSILLCSVFTMADTSLERSSHSLIYKNKIESKLIKIDAFLKKYDNFLLEYSQNFKTILSKYNCRVLENVELKKDCYAMKSKRLEALNRVKLKNNKLRLKVNEVLKLKVKIVDHSLSHP